MENLSPPISKPRARHVEALVKSHYLLMWRPVAKGPDDSVGSDCPLLVLVSL